ncbi:Uncharacterized protein HZ326_7881 [Fusarium oxysporum f. sp. albedinis]|nr:Uncharacterized protein HZ326_7881 [Fusarium oxysporum f. sp. albedinis]
MGLNECQTFTAKFDVTTELAGYPKAVLLMSCPDHDNFDVVVQIRKIDNKGRQLSHLNYPCPVAIDQVPDVNTAKTWGPQSFTPHLSQCRGRTYCVRRLVTRDRLFLQPPHPHLADWDVFAAGEDIALNDSGHGMCLPETDLCRLTEPEDENIGRHHVHTGGKYDSHLIIPVIMG